MADVSPPIHARQGSKLRFRQACGDSPWVEFDRQQRAAREAEQAESTAAAAAAAAAVPSTTPPPPHRRWTPEVPHSTTPQEEDVSLAEMRHELAALEAAQDSVEQQRQRELDVSQMAEADAGKPLEKRSLYTMRCYIDRGAGDAAAAPGASAATNVSVYLQHFIIHVLAVIALLMQRANQADFALRLPQGSRRYDAAYAVVSKLLQDCLSNFDADSEVRAAIAVCSEDVIVAACRIWAGPVSIPASAVDTDGLLVCVPDSMPSGELLRAIAGLVESPDTVTRHAATSAIRLHSTAHGYLVAASLRHIPEKEERVAQLQEAYGSASLCLKEKEAQLRAVADDLGGLRMGLAKEEARLGMAQRQLGTISRLDTVVMCLASDGHLPLDWASDRTFHRRSKYSVPKGPTGAIYSTGDEALFSHRQMVAIGILQSVSLVTAEQPDIDDILQNEVFSEAQRVANVLGGLARTWGDLLSLVIPNGRLAHEILEAKYETARLVVRLRAVQFLLQNLVRELKGGTSDLGGGGGGATDDQVFEHCRYYVTTLSPDLLLVFNWLVVLQSITSIANRTTPKERVFAQHVVEARRLREDVQSKGTALEEESLSLTSLVAVVGDSVAAQFRA